MELLDIGFGNLLAAGRIVVVVRPDSSPVKRIIKEAAGRGTLIDASCGHKTESVIVTDSDHVVLSSVSVESVAKRNSGLSDEA